MLSVYMQICPFVADKESLPLSCRQGDGVKDVLVEGLVNILPWPKKLKQARNLIVTQAKHRRVHDRSRACVTCARLFQFFWPG